MIRDLMIGGAPVEETAALWTKECAAVKQRMRWAFQRDSVAVTAGKYIDALLSDEQRKTSWGRAEVVGDPNPRE
ncbi:MAG: IS701 family transposase, partial [Alphaproteobacteria bacterium]|nr:IS701 family transposase [Alphaproteobacteria bacterium]